MCTHIFDINTKNILIKNEINNLVKMSKCCRLNQIFEIDCDNCFQIANIDLTVKFFKTVEKEIKKY